MKNRFYALAIAMLMLPFVAQAQSGCVAPANLVGSTDNTVITLNWQTPQMDGSVSGTTLLNENFDQYAANSYVAQQNTATSGIYWTTSTGTTGYIPDAKVSTTQASSGTQSMKVSQGSDMVLMLDNKTAGRYLVDFKAYVPAGQYGLITLHHFFSDEYYYEETARINLKHVSNGTNITAGGVSTDFTMNYDEWTNFRFDIDLDTKLGNLYVGASTTPIATWNCSMLAIGSSMGTNQLGALEFKASNNATFYIDDVTVTEYALYYNVYRNSQKIESNYQLTTYVDTDVVTGQNYDYYVTTQCSPTVESDTSNHVQVTHGTAHFATVITNVGTSSTTVTPFYNSVKYSWVEMLYTPQMVGVAGKVVSVSFYNMSNSPQTLDVVKVYMANRATTTFGSTSDWTPLSDLQLVYTGYNVAMPSETGWFTIPLDVPFDYDGVSALSVSVSKSAQATNSSNTWRYNSTSNAEMYKSNSTDVSASEYPTATGTRGTYLSDAKFKLVVTPGTCVKPCEVFATNATTSSIDIDWEENGATTWNLKYGAKGFDVASAGTAVNGLTANSYTITGLSTDTEYDVYVQAVCGGQGTEWTKTSFATSCESATIPIEETFENCSSTTTATVSSANLPACWDYINTGTYTTYAGLPNAYNGSTYAYQGTKSLRFYTYNTTSYGDQYALLPIVDTLSNLEITFWAREYSTSSNFQLTIGVIRNNEISTFEPLTTISPATTDHEFFTFSFGAYTGNGNRIALVAKRPDVAVYNSGYVDNISVHYIPANPSPQLLTATAVGENYATLDWQEAGSATQWDIELRDDDSETITTYNGITSHPYTISNLITNHPYSFRVRAVNGSETSEWSVWAEFRTECPPFITIPYFEDFDGYPSVTTVTSNNLPACWDYYTLGTSSTYKYYPIIYGSTSTAYTAYSGMNAMRFYEYYTAVTYDDQYAILPPVQNVSSLELSLMARETASTTTYVGKLIVGLADNSGATIAFDPVDTLDVDGIAYQQHIVNFSGYTGNYNRVAIMAPQTVSGYNSVMVDDISLHLIPTCPQPQDLSSADETETTAALSWTEVGSATQWNLCVVNMITNDSLTAVANSNPFTMTGLASNTPYKFCVRAVCSAGETSEWTPWYQFRTACPATLTIPYFEDFETWPGQTTGSTANIPACWDQLTTGTSTSYIGYPIVYSSTASAYSGTNSLRFYSYITANTYGNEYAVLPPVDNIQSLELSFMLLHYSTYTITLNVAVISDSDVANLSTMNLTPYQTFTQNTAGYQECIVNFRDYDGDGNRIVLYALQPTSSYNAGNVDDIRIYYSQFYDKPYDLAASSITSNSATIGWVDPNTGTSMWNVRVVGGNDTIDLVSFTNPVTVSGLSSSTEYEVTVQVIDSLGRVSTWSNPLSFVTQCLTTDTPIPYYMDFDSYSGTTSGTVNNLPMCWNYYNVGTSASYVGYPIIYNSSSYVNSAPNCLRFYSYVTSEAYSSQFAILPPMDNLSNKMLTFNARGYSTSTSYSAELTIGVITDPSDISTYQQITTCTPQTTDYEEFEVSFSSYTDTLPAQIVIGVMQPSSGYRVACVDDVVVDYIPSCPKIKQLSVTSLSDTQAVLTWSPDAGSYPEGYWLYYKQASQMVYDSVYTTGNSYTLTGLTPQTIYNWHVVAKCGVDDCSQPSKEMVFMTDCSSTQIPFSTNFDSETGSTSGTTNNLPVCWDYYNTGTYSSYAGYPIIYNGSASAYTGTNYLRFYTGYSSTVNYYGDQIAILPAIDSVSTAMVQFWARESTTTGTYVGKIVVGVMESSSDPESFVAIDTVIVETTSYEQFTVYMSSYNGDGKRIALKAPVPASGYNVVYLDDLSVGHIPACPPITNITVVNRTENGIVIDWTENGTATSWQIEYDTNAFVPGSGNVLTVSQHPYTITGLNPSTKYDFYVRSVCAGGPSAWVGPVSGVTLVSCGEGYSAYSGVIGNGTNAIYNIPVSTFYKHSYTQQIFTASEMAAMGVVDGYINTISFQYVHTVAQNPKPIEIYFGMTPLTAGGPWVNDSLLTKVFDGVVTFSNEGIDGWVDIQLDTPYHYDGSMSLAINVVNNSGEYSTSSTPTFAVHATDDYMAQYYQNDSQVVSTSTGGGTMIKNRNNVRFNACIDNSVCLPPFNIVADTISSNYARITWAKVGNPLSTHFEWGQEGFTPGTGNAVTITDTTSYFEMTNLLSNTTYTIYAYNLCTATDTSVVTTANITTGCDVTNPLPIIEDFEGVVGQTSGTTNNLPSCWNYISTGTSSSYVGYPIVYSTTASAYSGSNMLRFYSYGTATTYGDQYAILPPVDVTSGVVLKFYARCSSSTTTYTENSKLAIGVMSDPSDASTFVQYQLTEPNTINYREFVVFMDNIPATHKYVAMKAIRPTTTSGYNSLCVDDIELLEIGTCPIVTDIICNVMSDSTVSVSWTEHGTATSWEIEYGVAGFTHGSGTSLTVTAPAYTTITAQFASNTLYDIYVRPICSATDVGEWTKSQFRSNCGSTLPLPFAENFESWTGSTSGTTNNLPACWNYINTSTYSSYKGYPIIYSTSTYAQSTPNSLRFFVSNYSATYDAKDQIAIMPRVENLSEVLLKFAARKYSTGTAYSSHLLVGVMSDPADASTFHQIAEIDVPLTTYTDYEYFMPQYSQYGHYIAFKADVPASGGYNSLNIDNILLDTMPACPHVSNLMATASETTALLSWYENGTATSWDVEWGIKGFTLGQGTQFTVNTDTASISGLQHSSAYDFYVRPTCGGEWAGPRTFFTAQMPAEIPYSCGFEASDSESNKWVLENGDQTNQWFIGDDMFHTGAYSGTGGLYISYEVEGSPLGLIHQYVVTAASTVYAYRTFDLAQEPYMVSYKWLCEGQANYDYIRAFLVPAGQVPSAGNIGSITATNTPAGWIALDDGQMNGVTEWQTVSKLIDVPVAGYYNLVFCWTNNSATGNYPAGAIDEVQVFSMSCDAPTNLSVVTADNVSATVDWTENGDADTWRVEYGPKGFVQGNGTIDTVTAHPYTITDLSAGTQYDVYVQAVCDNLSAWCGPVTFTTALCEASQMCSITLELNSQTIDGWTGSVINMYSDNIFYGAYTIEAGNNHKTIVIDLCPATLKFEWVASQYSFTNEYSFTISNSVDEVVYNCQSAISLNSEQVFFTLEHSCSLCPRPTGLTATVDDNSAVVLSWNASDSISSFNIYRNNELLTTVGTTTYTDASITANGSYCYKVSSVCADDNESDMSIEACATIDNIDVAENAALAASLYPNPTSGKVRVEAVGIIRIEVMTILGQTIFSTDVDADKFEYDFSGDEAGVYMIRIETTTGSATKRLTVVK